MRSIYSFLIAILISSYCCSQTLLYSETFEQPSGADSIVSSGNPGWTINTTFAYEGGQSYHTSIAVSDTSYAKTIQFSTLGNNFVLFSFAHIAKISFFDAGILEVSFDNINWTHLKDTNTIYTGSPGSSFGSGTQNKFTATVYPIWTPGVDTLSPDNSWWRVETFDISALAANKPQVWLRFKSYDQFNDGSLGNYGWLIDDIKVVGYLCDPALTPGTASASKDSICNLDPVTLTLANPHGDIQWLSSTNGGLTWQLETGPGSNSDSLTVNPVQPIQYAAITSFGTCVSDTSNILTIHVEQVVAPNTTGNSRCGIGNVTLSASGNGTLNWYDAQTGGNLLDTGATYTPYITATTTYYVSSVVGGTSVGGSNLLITEIDVESPDALEIMNVSGSPIDVTGWTVAISGSYSNINTVNTTVQTLSGVMNPGDIIYWTDGAVNPWGSNMLWNPGAFPTFTGWAIIVDNSGDVVDFVAWEWPAAEIQAINITVGGFPVTIGTEWSGDGVSAFGSASGMSISRVGSSDNDDSTDFNIQTNSHGALNPGLIIPFSGGGCESPRTPVTATMTNAAAISINATSVSLCEGDPTTLTVTSSNPGYNYTWSPNVNLSSTTGASVVATPLSPITYYVIGDDGNCANIDSIDIDVGPAAIAGVASVPGDTVCTGNPTTLFLNGQQGNIQWFTSQDGVNWSPATGPGSDSSAFEVTPLTNTYYQAVLSSAGCPEDTSNIIFITSLSPVAPSVTSTTRCGYGEVTVQATGNGTIHWYPDTSTLIPLGSGNTFTDTIQSTTTYYAANIVGGNVAVGEITLGTGTLNNATNAGPTYISSATSSFRFSKHISIYTAAEILAAGGVPGVISQISWFKTNTNGYTHGDAQFDIYIKPVSFTQHAVSPINWANEIVGATLVYSSNTQNLNTSIGWQDFLFTTPFYWNGSDNLEVFVDWFRPDAPTGAVNWEYTTTTNANAITGASAAVTNVTRNNNRPNIKLDFSGGGCSSPRIPVTATVTPPPAMSLTTSADSLCLGDSVTLNVTSSNAGYNYTWSPNTGLSSTTGSTVSASPSSTIEYTLIADDGICGNIDSITITVSPMTVAGIANGPDTVCSGVSAFLSVSGHTGSVQWQSFDGANWVDETGTGSDSANYQVIPTQTTTYQAIVQNGVCPAIATNPLTVVVINPMNPVTTGDSRCGPGLVNLSATGIGNFYWYEAPQGGTHVNIGTAYSPNLSQTTTYYVETVIGGDFYSVGPINNGFGNQTSASNSNYGMTFNVTTQATLEKVHVYPWSTGVITINLRIGTGPVLATVTDSVYAFTGKTEIPLGFPLSPANDYRLELVTNGVLLGRNSSHASYPYTVAGGPMSITGYFNPNPGTGAADYRYFYDWLVSTGCKSARIPVTGEILGLPSAPVITQQGNLLVSSSPSNNQWYYQGVAIPGATSQTYAPDTAGQYYVVVDNGSCQETSNTLFFIHVSIEDAEQISLQIYPNPNSGLFTIEFDIQEKDIDIEIYNVLGEIVHSERLAKVSGKYSGVIDITSQADGLYFLLIKSGEAKYIQKLIVSK